MENENNNIWHILFWVGLIIAAIWVFGSSVKSKDTEYIRREFNNGKVIEVPVDESITRDTWDCTGDCSGHDAGYEWAEEQGISNPGDCGGNSESFIEGCEAYANENY